jgi:hypothetical protein
MIYPEPKKKRFFPSRRKTIFEITPYDDKITLSKLAVLLMRIH